MILHDFTYAWDGKSHKGEKPIAWWPGAYRVRIIRLGAGKGEVQHLFPLAVLLKSVKPPKGDYSLSLKNYIHNFAEKIAKTYGLDIRKTLWVELRDVPRVAHLKPDRALSDLTLYSFSWRRARPNELEMLQPYISGLSAED